MFIIELPKRSASALSGNAAAAATVSSCRQLVEAIGGSLMGSLLGSDQRRVAGTSPADVERIALKLIRMVKNPERPNRVRGTIRQACVQQRNRSCGMNAGPVSFRCSWGPAFSAGDVPQELAPGARHFALATRAHRDANCIAKEVGGEPARSVPSVASFYADDCFTRGSTQRRVIPLRPLWITGCRGNYVGSTSGVPRIAAT